ncbi:MAG: nucleotidyl transferase AbiEii/AbiGii toxin family protein [Anaerolineales bacterium]|nr:nucleotidyl transferase AbiEii/AbiGii toxin family protein [Anaerolineales bacterium]
MPTGKSADSSLFLNILQTLERIHAPYMIIGAFAGTFYGINRVTYDIDIVVDLSEEHIQALSDSYPLPRFYADPEMIRNSINMGIMFNIIDTERGEKADLVPLNGTLEYRPAFERRVRQTVEMFGEEPFEVWSAKPDDIVHGKLMAWTEGRSRKHETDIFDMLLHHYLRNETILNISVIDKYAKKLGEDTRQLWEDIKSDAKKQMEKNE